MRRILICWEDRYHEKLDLCLKRATQAGGPPVPPLALFFDDVRGNGGFDPYVRRDWPKAAGKGLLKSGGPIDYLVCIADADRASDCCSIERAPSWPTSSSAWVEEANERWTGKLRGVAAVAADRVIGRFLRWNKESLIVAGHDVEEVLLRLGCRDKAALQQHLAACQPPPDSLSDDLFAETYRNPGRCLRELLVAAGAEPLRKGHVALDDALDAVSRHALPRLAARVPDLAALATFLRGLP